jgi:hypothetical protein
MGDLCAVSVLEPGLLPSGLSRHTKGRILGIPYGAYVLAPASRECVANLEAVAICRGMYCSTSRGTNDSLRPTPCPFPHIDEGCSEEPWGLQDQAQVDLRAGGHQELLSGKCTCSLREPLRGRHPSRQAQ